MMPKQPLSGLCREAQMTPSAPHPALPPKRGEGMGLRFLPSPRFGGRAGWGATGFVVSVARNLHKALLVCLVLFPSAPACAQDEDDEERGAPEVAWNGMEYFRHKLHEADFKPLRSWNDFLSTNPERTVIVLVGPRSVQQFFSDRRTVIELQAMVANGAAILIATDQSTERTSLSDLFHVKITGEMVTANAEDCFRGKAYHPFVSKLPDFRGQEDSPTQMFQELSGAGEGALATNYPSVLQITSDRIRTMPLADYPGSARSAKRQLTGRVDLFAAGGFYQRGRYLALADHSIFLNQMLLATSDGTDLLNSNLAFTIDCIDWLKGPQKRDRCYFIEDGNVRTDFELKFPNVDDSDLERILKLMMFLEANGNGNRIIQMAQEENLFNSIITSFISSREIVRAVIIVLVCLSMFFALWLTIRNRAGPDPARALVTPELAAMIPKGDVLRQRFDSLHEVENIYEAARHLIRDFLAGMNAEPDEHGLPPKLVIEDGYADEEGLRRKLGRLWRIAYDSEPVKVTPESWKTIKEDLKEVLTDADDGWWKFVRRTKDEG